MKKLLTLCLSCLMAFSLVACGSKDTSDKTLTVLTSSGYAPYEVVDGEGNLSGFDIDVMEACADILGYEIKWKDMDFDGIVDSIKNDQGDLAIAGISPTPKRAEEVDFSTNYYATDDSQNWVLAKSDSAIEETADIKGLKVGIQMGTIQEEAANEIKDEYELTLDARKSYADLLQDLINGNIDFMILEKAVAVELVNEREGLKAFRLEAGTDPSGNAIMFKKGSSLTEEFNSALAELKENGTLDKLIEKYFSVEE